MSSRLISFSYKVDGVLTDVTSAVLRDPTLAFGVKRTDTGAIIVAAGTAFTHVGTGLYQYTITDPAPGLTYQYWIEIVADGETQRIERYSYPPAEADDDVYLTLAEADALAAVMVAAQVAVYVAAGTADRTASLLEATRRIDAAMRYQGRKYELDQVLEFPRVPYESGSIGRQLAGPPYPPNTQIPLVIWDWDANNDVAVVPAVVKRACLLEANSILDGRRDDALDAQARGLASQSIGSASESYTQASAGQGAQATLCRQAMQLMDFYRLRSGPMR